MQSCSCIRIYIHFALCATRNKGSGEGIAELQLHTVCALLHRSVS